MNSFMSSCKGISGFLISAFFLASVVFAPHAAAGVYDVSGAEAKAQAADAVIAKEKAIAEARTNALRSILERITRSSDHARLPQITAELADQLVSGLSVEREVTSPTSYDARLTLRFDPSGIQQLLTQAGIRFSDRQAPATLIVPIYKDGDSLAIAEQNPVMQGWRALDLAGGLTPVKLPTGNIAEQGVDLGAVVAGTPDAVSALRHLYEVDFVLVNTCEASDTAQALTCTLDGEGPGGLVQFSEQFAGAGDPDAAAQSQARQMLAKLEDSYKEGAPNQLSGNRDGLAVDVYAPFSSVGEWQTLRSRLTTLPGIGDIEVLSLNARGAFLTLYYAGTMEDLVGAMTVADIEIFDSGGQIEVRVY